MRSARAIARRVFFRPRMFTKLRALPTTQPKKQQQQQEYEQQQQRQRHLIIFHSILFYCRVFGNAALAALMMTWPELRGIRSIITIIIKAAHKGANRHWPLCTGMPALPSISSPPFTIPSRSMVHGPRAMSMSSTADHVRVLIMRAYVARRQLQLQ